MLTTFTEKPRLPSRGPTTTKDRSTGFSLELALSIARMLWKHPWTIGLITLVLSTGWVILVKRLPLLYRAQAVIVVDSQTIPEKFVSATVTTDVQKRLSQISEEILSDGRLKAIIEEFHLYQPERKRLSWSQVIAKMRKNITIESQRNWTGTPGAFQVSYVGSNPTVVAMVTNRLANLYVEENLKTREIQAESTSEFLDNQLLEAKGKLDQLEKAVSRYKIQHNGELPEQENSLLGALNRLQVELQGNQNALDRAQQTLIATQNNLQMAEAEEAVLEASARSGSRASASADSAAGNAAPKRSDQIQAQLSALRVRYNDDYPQVQVLKTELAQALRAEEIAAKDDTSRRAAAQKRLPASPEGAALLASAASPELMRARERTADLKAQVVLLQREIATRTAEHDRIVHTISDYQDRVDRLPIREQEMAGLTRDYEMTQANYKSLLDKKISAEMANEMEHRQKAERFTIVNPARPPDEVYKPNRRLLAAGGCVLSLLFAVALVLGYEFKMNLILGEWELGEHAPILGRIPVIEFRASAEGSGSSKRPGTNQKRAMQLMNSSSLQFVALAGAALALEFMREVRG
jgi:succinoglycan biosynthesis transport protein ExoP